jgi:hypothetical protein
MRGWVDVLKGRPVVGPADEPIGNVLSVEVETGSWRVLQIRVLVDGEVAAKVGMKRPLLGRPALDVAVEHLSDAGGHLRLGGGYAALENLASAQGALLVDRMRARMPRPAERRNPEPADSASKSAAADE